MGNDKYYLAKAVEKAAQGVKNGGGPFGALIVKDDKILSEEYNRVVLNADATAHAEVLAIRRASELLGKHDLSGCVLYTSCEPCPMCLGAVYWSGITKVVYAGTRTDAEEAGFSDKFIYDEIALPPADRKITFMRIDDQGAKEVFNGWIEHEGKIPY